MRLIGILVVVSWGLVLPVLSVRLIAIIGIPLISILVSRWLVVLIIIRVHFNCLLDKQSRLNREQWSSRQPIRL